MKKGCEWLAMLPKNAQFKWYRGILSQKTAGHARFVLDFEFKSMGDFILMSFLWAASRDGNSYWAKIAANEQYIQY